MNEGEQFEGRVYERGEEGYEAARLDAVWNLRKPDRFPEVIVRADSDDDVVAAVRLARRRGLQVGIRSGGHSWVGNCLRNGAVLVDLSEMQGIDIAVDDRIAAVRPATRGPVLLAALAKHGLYFPAGHASTVGVGGYSLGGGYGWNGRTFGPACLSIQAVDAVLADGSLIHATDATHPELMWAARGSGPGFFAIVTRLYFRVYEHHEQALRSSYMYPLELRDEVFTWSLNELDTLPQSIEMSAKVGFSPGNDTAGVTLNAVSFCTNGEGVETLDFLEKAPFRHHAVRATTAVEMTMEDLYRAGDSGTPPSWRYSVDGIWCSPPAERILEAAGSLLEVPSPRSFLLWMLWGHYDEADNACWSAQAPLYLSPNAVWSDPADDLRHERWAHGDLARMAEVSEGLQFSDNNVAARLDDGLSKANQARLEELRRRFDPEGLICSYMKPDESRTALALAGGISSAVQEEAM